MSIMLQNPSAYDPSLLAEAKLFPAGMFIAVDDQAYTENGLGRKVVQTMPAKVGDRDVSLAYIDDDATSYDLVLASESPNELGTYADILRLHGELHDRLQITFGGVGKFSTIEMVTAIMLALDNPQRAMASVVVEAKSRSRRGRWVIANRFDAMTRAPIDWATVGL
ncbi:MAG: hypothetical protein ACREPQ_00485 [Rhodanobacter sp.]